MKLSNRNQKGFTLIEIVIAVAITGLVVAAASGAIIQVIQSTHTSAHMNALRQVQTAGYWVSKDALQAQSITTGPDRGFPLTLNWTEWNGNVHCVVYSLEGTQLQRVENGTLTGPPIQYIDAANTGCQPSGRALAPGEVLTFKVTAIVMGARGPQTETRTYEVQPRPLS